MAAQAATLAATVAVLVVIGRSFQLSTTVAGVVAVSAAVFLMGLDFGLVTMAAGRWPAGGVPPSGRGRRWPLLPT
jgi:hypothetical protein